MRVIDLNGLEGYSAGVVPQVGSVTPGMKEVGYFRFTEDSDAWAAKVHRYNAKTPAAAEQGLWLNPRQTIAHVAALRARLGNTSVDRPICLLRGLTS